MVHEHIVNGEVCFLVQPVHVGCKWTQANKHFRSSLWNSEGELISAGFPKFTNWGENPENFPVPTSLRGSKIMEKLDGSLLIVSKYHGQFIARTRGTTDARNLEKNGHEIEIFNSTILPKIEEFYGQGAGAEWNCSFLFEWTSPLQRIVLNYGEQPEWCLVGIILHGNYHLQGQEYLDYVASVLEVKRPAVYDFPDIEALLANVEVWRGKEGVCVYSDHDQTIHKVKSAWYLALHHMKSELASFEKVIDTFFTLDRPSYQEFYQKIAEQFDFELANQIQGDMSRICDGWKEVVKIEKAMYEFVEDLKRLPNRKEQAMKTIQSYGNTNRASFIFKILDGKNLGTDDVKKLLYQVLKK